MDLSVCESCPAFHTHVLHIYNACMEVEERGVQCRHIHECHFMDACIHTCRGAGVSGTSVYM